MSVPRPRLVPALVLAATLAVLALDAWWVLGLAERPPDVARLRRAEAERVLVYRVDATAGPRFELDGKPAVLRLSTHLALPRGTPHDPARRVRYALVLELVEGGRATWRRELAVESRQSKAEPSDGTWRHEAAFADDPDVQLTDERLLLARLPACAPGARLTVTATVAEGEEVLMRAFVERARTDGELTRAEALLAPEERVALLSSSTWVPWALVPEAERRQRLARRGERLSAIGERDLDYRLRTIYVSSFRAREAPPVPGEVVELGPGRPAALLVTGPADVRLDALDPDAGDLTIHVTRLDAGGAREEHLLVVGHGAPARIALPAGVASLTLEADVVRRLAVTAPAAAAFPPRPGTATVRLAPARVAIGVERLGPGRPPVELPIWPEDVAGSIGRIVRLELRRVLEPVPGVEVGATARVRLRFVDARGRSLGEEQQEVVAPEARFERAHDDPAAPGARVSEPVSFVALAPAGARSLTVEADAPVIVRALRPGTEPNAVASPHAEVPLGPVRWRYAPLATRRFLTFASVAGRNLRPSDRVVVLAQARLEPAAASDEPIASGPSSTLEPLDPVERQIVRELVPPERLAEVVRAAPPGLVTRLRPGVATRLTFDAARPGAPRIAYAIPPSALGATVRVTIDGKAIDHVLRDTRGSFTLPRQAGGAREVRLDAPAEAVVTIDRPPVVPRAGDVHVERTVWAMGSAPVRVRAAKAPAEALTIVAVIYGPADAAGTVRVVIGGGRPARREHALVAGLTRVDRTVPLPPPQRSTPASFRDRDGDAGVPRAIGATLREDLAGGTHELGVYSRSGRPLWVRFYVRREGRRDAEIVQWQRTVDEELP